MAGNSYLSPADADVINQVRRDILATKIELQEPAVSLVLARQNSAGTYVDRAAQTVYMKIEKPSSGASSTRNSGTSMTQVVTGYFQKESPFDIQVKDEFTLSNGWAGHVTAVSPAKAGIIRADFELTTGYAP